MDIKQLQSNTVDNQGSGGFFLTSHKPTITGLAPNHAVTPRSFFNVPVGMMDLITRYTPYNQVTFTAVSNSIAFEIKRGGDAITDPFSYPVARNIFEDEVLIPESITFKILIHCPIILMIMDTSSNELTHNETPDDVIPNRNDAKIGGLEEVVKNKLTLDPGLSAQVPLEPFLQEYITRLMSPIPLTFGTWTTSNTGSLFMLDVSPTAAYTATRFIPYFTHELFKWNSFKASFRLRIVFFASSAYRGSLSIRRTFNDNSPTSNQITNETIFNIDGGNYVYEHVVRPTSYSNYKHTLPNFPPGSLLNITYQDVYYEKIVVNVRSQLSAPSIYPIGVPYVVLLIPNNDVEFSTRRNNLTKNAPSASVIRSERGTWESILYTRNPKDFITRPGEALSSRYSAINYV